MNSSNICLDEFYEITISQHSTEINTTLILKSRPIGNNISQLLAVYLKLINRQLSNFNKRIFGHDRILNFVGSCSIYCKLARKSMPGKADHCQILGTCFTN